MEQPGTAVITAAIIVNLKMMEEIRALEIAVDKDLRTIKMRTGVRRPADRVDTGKEMTREMNIRDSRNTVGSRHIRVITNRITKRLQIIRGIRIMPVDFRDSRHIRDKDRIHQRYTA